MDIEDRRKWEQITMSLEEATADQLKYASDAMIAAASGTIHYDKFFEQACFWSARALDKVRIERNAHKAKCP